MLATRGGPAGSGKRFPPKEQPKEGWTCPEGHENRSYAKCCMAPGCREKRPS